MPAPSQDSPTTVTGPARLTAETARIAAYEQANLAQEAAKGKAQQATDVQRHSISALHTWIAQYRKIARVALRHNPQALEKIGIAVRTAKTATHRAANNAPATEEETASNPLVN